MSHQNRSADVLFEPLYRSSVRDSWHATYAPNAPVALCHDMLHVLSDQCRSVTCLLSSQQNWQDTFLMATHSTPMHAVPVCIPESFISLCRVSCRCEREVKWAADYLLKLYVPSSASSATAGKWGDGDSFVVQVNLSVCCMQLSRACMLDTRVQH